MTEDKAAYTLVRESGFYDRVYFMLYRLGIQSNILVSARYVPAHTNPVSENRLSRAAVIAGLRAAVEAHPALRMFAVMRESGTNNKHYLGISMLHRIDLDQCVQFLDNEDTAGAEFFEEIHNTWDWLDKEPRHPWWKAYVVGGRDVVLVLHHFVADANSGIQFHRTLLNGLESKSVNPIVNFDLATTAPFPEPMTLSNHKASMPEIIWIEFKRFFICVLSGLTLLFNSLPRPKPYFKSATELAPPEMWTVTRTSSLRIPAQKMESIVAACRANGTTFTGLLVVMLLATFAVDLFPHDKIGCSRFAFDLRPYIRMPRIYGAAAQDGVMMNGGAGGYYTHWLENYRGVVSNKGRAKGSAHPRSVDAQATWKLARWYRQAILNGMPNKFIRGWIAGALLGDDLEEFVGRALGGIGRVSSKSFLVSNLGAFTFQPKEEDKMHKVWRIEDLQFSGASANGYVGSCSLVFNVVGVKGGDTVIHLSYEEGVVGWDMAEGMLKATMNKLELLLGSEGERPIACEWH